METALLLLSLAAAMAFGMLFNRFAKKIGLPNVTGYLLAGLLIGPSLWKLIPGSFDGLITDSALSSLGLVSAVALGFIAFSIGGEFKWSTLKQIGGKAVVITLFESLAGVLFVDAALCCAAAFSFGGINFPIALTLGAIAAATAPAATLMVVRQYRAKGPVTQMLLPVVALDDAVALIAFAVSFSIARALASGEAVSFVSMVGKPVLNIALSLLSGAAIGFLLSFSLRFFHSRANKLMLTLTAVIAGVAIAQFFDLSALLLCMAASAFVVNFSHEADRLFADLDAWTPPVFMLFFVISGAQLKLEILPKVGIMGVLYIFFRSLGKYLGARWGSAAVKAEPNVKKYLGVTLLPQAGVAIGLAATVVATAGFDAYAGQVQAVILTGTLLYELAGPLLTKAALTAAGEIEKPKKEKRPERGETRSEKEKGEER